MIPVGVTQLVLEPAGELQRSLSESQANSKPSLGGSTASGLQEVAWILQPALCRSSVSPRGLEASATTLDPARASFKLLEMLCSEMTMAEVQSLRGSGFQKCRPETPQRPPGTGAREAFWSEFPVVNRTLRTSGDVNFDKCRPETPQRPPEQAH